MSGVAIYMEGGGNKGNGRTALRQGMDAFLDPLKEAARAKEIHWKLICCGSRNEAFRGFRNALRNGDDGIVVLLVDSEGLVQGAPRAHLHARDRWELTGVEDTAVHLMVQTMETWIVADMDTLSGYYGQRFNQRALPRATDRCAGVGGAFPISRSRAHTHRRHGHPLQTVPSAGLIERPQEKNRVDALR